MKPQTFVIMGSGQNLQSGDNNNGPTGLTESFPTGAYLSHRNRFNLERYSRQQSLEEMFERPDRRQSEAWFLDALRVRGGAGVPFTRAERLAVAFWRGRGGSRARGYLENFALPGAIAGVGAAPSFAGNASLVASIFLGDCGDELRALVRTRATSVRAFYRAAHELIVVTSLSVVADTRFILFAFRRRFMSAVCDRELPEEIRHAALISWENVAFQARLIDSNVEELARLELSKRVVDQDVSELMGSWPKLIFPEPLSTWRKHKKAKKGPTFGDLANRLDLVVEEVAKKKRRFRICPTSDLRASIREARKHWPLETRRATSVRLKPWQFVAWNTAAETIANLRSTGVISDRTRDWLFARARLYIASYRPDNFRAPRWSLYQRMCDAGVYVRALRCTIPHLAFLRLHCASDDTRAEAAFAAVPHVETLADLAAWENAYFIGPLPINYQGNAQSGPSFKIEHDIPALQTFRDAVKELADASPESSGFVRKMVQVTSFVAALAFADRWQSAVAAVFQFCAGYDTAYHRVVELFKSGTNYQASDVSDEGLSLLVEGAAIALSAAIITSISFAESATNRASYGIPFLMEGWKAMKGATFKSVAEYLLKRVTELLRRLHECVKERSFLPLFGGHATPSEIIKEIELMMTYFPVMTIVPGTPTMDHKLAALVKEGVLPPEWIKPVTPAEFVRRGEWARERLLKSLSIFANSPVGVSGALVARKFRDFLDGVVSAGFMAELRVPPLLIVLYGPPGGGKSNFARTACQALARRFGYDPGAAGIYEWQKSVNFQTGLTHTQWAVIMDDVDHSLAAPTAGIKTHIEEIIALVNTAPYPVEAADLALKGKLFANPHLVIVSTNFRNSRVNEFSLRQGAYWRRVGIQVEMQAGAHVSLGATKNGREQMDSVLANQQKDWNLHDSRVFMRPKDIDETQGFPLTERKDLAGLDDSALVRFFGDELARHRTNARETIAQSIGVDLEACPYCFMNIALKRCSCPEINYQGMESNGRKMLAFLVSAFWFVVYFRRSPIERHIAARATLYKLAEWYFRAKAVYARVENQYRAFALDARGRVELMYERARVGALDAASAIARFGAEYPRAVECLVVGVGVVAALIGVRVAMAALSSAWNFQARTHLNDGSSPPGWLTAEQEFRPGLAPKYASTFTFPDLQRDLARAMFWVRGPKLRGHAVALSHNVLLMPTHYLQGMGASADFEFVYGKETFVRRISKADLEPYTGHKELVLVHVPGLPGHHGVLSKIVPICGNNIAMYDELFLMRLGPESWIVEKVPRNETGFFGEGPVIYSTNHTEQGDCGQVYVARMGPAYWIVSMHFASDSFAPDARAVSARLSRQDLTTGVLRLAQFPGVAAPVETAFQASTGEFRVTPIPDKSTIRHAQQFYGADVHLVGHIEKIQWGSTPTTRIKPSVFSADLKELCDRLTGEPDYWRTPTFTGEMRNGVWWSPHCEAFVTTNRKKIDSGWYWLAIADFLSGADELDLEGYDELSEVDALNGIPGSYVRGINLTTSAGPPLKGTKNEHMKKGENPGFSPQFAAILDELERLVKEGTIPMVPSFCLLKDECVKPGKVPRVFNNVPGAFNLRLKRALAAIHSFMRGNTEFFECAVGTDMSSSDMMRLVRKLAAHNPELNALLDLDCRRLDKSWTEQMQMFVALLYVGIASLLGLDPQSVYAMTVAGQYIVYLIKGDGFQARWNTSGWDPTVQFNGFAISILMRISYYMAMGVRLEDYEAFIREFRSNYIASPCVQMPAGFPRFRDRNSLLDYGDDVLAHLAPELVATVSETFTKVFGIEVTDAAKTGKVQPRSIREVEFLKRRFVWDEELRVYICPLSKKSLARMIGWNNDSSMTAVDHACVTLTEALREGVLHGREFYDMLKGEFDVVVARRGCASNAFYFAPEYEHYRQQMREGKFRSWAERLPNFQSGTEDRVVFSNMSSDNITVKQGSDPAGNAEIQQPTTNIQTGIGQILSESTMTQTKDPTILRVTQSFPDTDLADFLSRPVFLGSRTLGPTDIGTSLFGYPWALFLANASVAQKTDTFSYIEGRLQVFGVVAIPGNCFGSYVISARPDADVVDATVLPPEYSMLVDNYVRIDCASSENFVIELPFVWPYDVADITKIGNSWSLFVSTLAPLKTAIAGGVQAGTISFYGALVPGYKMVVPNFQGRGHVTPSHGTKRFTPKLHERLHEAASGLVKSTGHAVGNALGLKQDGAAEKFAAGVQGVAEKLQGVPVIGSAAGTVAKAAGMAKKLFHHFGFTRENSEPSLTHINTMSVSNQARLDGTDTIPMVNLTAPGLVSIDPGLVGATAEDPLSTASFFQRWARISTFTWATTDVADTLLKKIWVSPYATDAWTGNDKVRLTAAGYYGMGFDNWRGDMEYLVVIPVSKIHRGTLAVIWNGVGPADPTISDLNQAMHLLYDVSSGKDLVFSIGYARDVPFLPKVMASTAGIYNHANYNGSVSLRVLNPLAGQSATASVSVSVYARAKPNMQFSMMSLYMQVPDLGYGAMWRCFVYQGASGDEDGHEVDSVAIVADSDPYPMDEVLYGTQTPSIRALLQKPMRMWLASPTAGEKSWTMTHYPATTGVAGGQGKGFYTSLHAHLMAPFIGFASSTRWQFIADQNAFVMMGPVGPGGPGSVVYSTVIAYPNMHYATQTGEQRGTEVIVPYSESRKFFCVGNNFVSQTTRRDYVHVEGGTMDESHIAMYYSLGQDIRCAGFRCLPAIDFNVTATGPNEPTTFVSN